MASKFGILAALSSIAVLSACIVPPTGQAYWQRVEDHSAMYMTGPKAQQTLDEDLAGCVREVDELVELGALRAATPPDTHTEYLHALEASGDLDWYDTPTRHGVKNVSHTEYQDFEGCMRYRGWERVRFVRYQTALKSQQTYSIANKIRWWGGLPGRDSAPIAETPQEQMAKKDDADFGSVNN